jgi:hypothetical protein
MALPGSYRHSCLVEGIEPAAQALASQHIQLDLSHIEPAAVGRRVHELKTLPELLGLFRREGLVERTSFKVTVEPLEKAA